MTATAPLGAEVLPPPSDPVALDAFANQVAEDLAAAMNVFLGEVERLFRPAYETALVEQWLPAAGAPVARLSYGGQLADVGCGRGAAAVAIAQRYPLASVHGFDTDGSSIEAARVAARRAGVHTRCRFTRCAADDVPAGGYDVLVLGSLHDLPDPVGAARRARKVVAADGVVLVAGPMTGGASLLGTVPGPAATTQLLRRAGFGEVTTVAATPFHYVLAANPPR